MDENLKPSGPKNTIAKEGENVKAPRPRTDTAPKSSEVSVTGYRIFLAVLIMAFLGVGITGAMRFGEMEDTIASQKAALHAKTEIIGTTIDLANVRIELLILENEALKRKLELLKTKERSAQESLEAYILRKYKTVPKVVAKEVATQVVKLTKEEGVPFSLIVGLIEVESQFKPWAISKKDARGLMQVMPWWVTNKKAKLGIKSKYDLHDIETNIRAGIAIFKIHLKEAKNDINQGLYLYVGKDKTYANKVFNAMGHFEIFRSTLNTSLRDGADQEAVEGTNEGPVQEVKKKISLKRITFDKEAYARA